MTMAIAVAKNTMTMDDEWNTFIFKKYVPARGGWWTMPPLIISKEYEENQAKKKKENIEFSRSLSEKLTKMWEEDREARIQKKMAEEESKPKVTKVEVEVAEKKKTYGGFQKSKPVKKVRVVESNHNEARRAKKNEKKVLDKARAEAFQNSSLLFDDSWIISIGQALGMEKPQFHIREIKEKLAISCMEKVKVAKPEDEITKDENSNLTEEQLEILSAEEKKDEAEINIARANATEAIEVATVVYEADVIRRTQEKKELEIANEKKKAELVEVARAKAEISLMSQADLESQNLDDDDYDLYAILKQKGKKLSFEVRFPIWKKVELPVIKMGSSSVAEQPNVVSATVLKPKKNRLCRSLKLGAEPCTNEKCPFLHTLKELKHNPCPFKKCGRVKLLENGKYKNIGVGCPYHHINEAPKDYFIRDGFLPVPEGHYDTPKVEVQIHASTAVTTTKTSIVEVKVDVISCTAWTETNTKVLSYPGQKVEEVSTRVVEKEPVVVETPKEVKNNKTKMCDSFSSGHPCRHGEKCRYAHSTDELVILECQHGEKCLFVCTNSKGVFHNSNGKFCKFIHPTESRENYFARNGIKFEVVEKKPVCTNKTCTKVCNSVIQGFECRHKACNFAHSVDELNIRECSFPNCKLVCHDSRGNVRNTNPRNKCSFFHHGETKESFFARIVSKY